MRNFTLVVAITLAALTGSLKIYAHEGHDKTPGALTAPHGGVVKGTAHLYLELVTEKSGVKIYPFDHDMKPVPAKDIRLEAKMQIPRKNKTEAVKFETKDDHFTARVDAKGAHRYDLNLSVTHNSKAEKVKFSVEPL
ncbi:MAG: hypothetical protein U1E10_14850 [Bdellovibrionales bacterium]|nr:hypothetical protein [Bdellovibrionales bacterium]